MYLQNYMLYTYKINPNGVETRWSCNILILNFI